MKLFTTLTMLLIVTTFQSANAQSAHRSAERANGERILGGTEVASKNGPWTLRLKIKKDYAGVENARVDYCGASLVSPRTVDGYEVSWPAQDPKAQWAITAAHCILEEDGTTVDAGEIEVTAGVLDLNNAASGERRKVNMIVPHPHYRSTSKGLENDIALLKLNSSPDVDKLPFYKRSSIALPRIGDVWWINKPYLATYAQGWGATAEGASAGSQQLLEVRMPLVDRKTCTTAFEAFGSTVGQDMICAGFQSGGFDSCQGDSGGPLLFRPMPNSNINLEHNFSNAVLLGVVSWGKGCGRQDLFGIYSSAAYHLDWLDFTFLTYSNCVAGAGGNGEVCQAPTLAAQEDF